MTLTVTLVLSLLIIPAIIGIIIVNYNKSIIIPRINLKTIKYRALLFHSVDTCNTLELSQIKPYKFEQILSYLKRNHYQTLSVSELKLHLEENCTHKKIPAALFFDDGYENFYIYVFPLLEKYKMKASIFPVVNCINKYSSWDIYRPKKHLSRIQIQEISNAGHEIGSHTLSHADLTLLSSRDVKYELLESKKILEDLTGKPVGTISFPFGSCNKRIWNIASDIGYKVGVVYRNQIYTSRSIILPTGVYSFDSISDIVEKIERTNYYSPVHSRDIIMPHFAKGTSLWKYRKSYNVLRSFK